jgi:hypothetical protein
VLREFRQEPLWLAYVETYDALLKDAGAAPASRAVQGGVHMNAMPVFIILIKRAKIARTEGAVAGV